MSVPLLSVQNLQVSFGDSRHPVHAVQDVSLELLRGECLGIVGESGSGKSVTAWAIAGLLGKDAQTKGSLLVDGASLSTLSKSERRELRGTKIAMIFQEPSRSFDPIYSIENTFLETMRAHNPRLSKEECHQRALALLAEVHIPEPEKRLKSFPHQFSGGMLQRVMIALALANNPEILICDEPTTALDVTIQAQIVALLGELKVQRGLSLLFISHDLDLVARIADRILVMYGGVVLEEGPTERVLASPKSPYTQALWDSRIPWGHHFSTDKLSQIGGAPPDPRQPESGCPFAPRCPKNQNSCRDALPPLESSWSDASHRTWRCLFPGGSK